MRILILASLIHCVLALPQHAHAQATTEQESLYIQRVEAARSALHQADASLAETERRARPMLAELDALRARRAEVSAQIARLLDQVDEAQAMVRSLPNALEDRANALISEVERLVRNKSDAALLERREHELRTVLDQVEAFEAADSVHRAHLADLSARRDSAFDERDRIDAQLNAREAEEQALLSALREAGARAAEAQIALDRAIFDAGLFLRKNAPPFLVAVEAGPQDDPIYAAEWNDPEQELEDLLRLATYLYEDLSRTIPRRQELIDNWIASIQTEQAAADAALERYRSLVGGSSDNPFWRWAEQGLDYITFGYGGGALVTGGALTWTKISWELLAVEANIAAGTITGGGTPAAFYQALATETFGAVYSALTTKTKNPSWDVVANKVTPDDVVARAQRGPTAEEEMAMLDAISSETIRQSLFKMRGLVSDDLQAENFRDQLLSKFDEKTLAAAFSESVYFDRPPSLDISTRTLLNQPPENWVFNTVFSSVNVRKTVLSELAFSTQDWYENPSAGMATLVTGQVVGLVISIVEQAGLEKIERTRIEAWGEYIGKATEVRFSLISLQNEGRAKRIEEKIRRVLAKEVIPMLRRELLNDELARDVTITRDGPLTASQTEIRLTFSAPVTVQSMRLDAVEIEFEGEANEWRGRFDPSDIGAPQAPLVVRSHHAALPDRELDDPRTVARWSDEKGAFVSYEPGLDNLHTLRFKPATGLGYAIVFDTSGSMEENNRIGKGKAAMSEFFASTPFEEDTQFSLFTFRGECGISQDIPFTNDRAAIESAIQGLGTGSSTAIANSIYRASQAVLDQNFERGVLIVVTDGEEVCDGNVPAALSFARRSLETVKMRGVR